MRESSPQTVVPCNRDNPLARIRRPGLLVSVRSAAEAELALDGGADLIDVKEPDAGALGAASPTVIRDVVRVVARRTPVSAAAGELVDWEAQDRRNWRLPAGVALAKFGLAGCGKIRQWTTRWHRAVDALSQDALPVAVVYADWRTADAPHPEAVAEAAINRSCPALLIDTFEKREGGLFDCWPVAGLSVFVRDAQQAGLLVVLAGSLHGPSFARAAGLDPALVAVRGAACREGRGSPLSKNRVLELRQILNLPTNRVPSPADP